MAPTFVAFRRHHNNRHAILALNFIMFLLLLIGSVSKGPLALIGFLGCTSALVWSLTANIKNDKPSQ